MNTPQPNQSVSRLRRENRAFAFSFFYSMLCLGCLLGSVLINIVRDMMMDGAVILGVPCLRKSGLGWLVFLKGLGDPMFWRVVMDTCGLLLVVYFRYCKQRSCGLFISGKRSWTFRCLVLRSPHLDSTIILTEVKISWMRMVLGLSSSRSWWIFLLSCVRCVSSCLSCCEWLRKYTKVELNHWIMLLLRF